MRIQWADSRSRCEARRYACRMPIAVARALSILGHPLLCLPAAALLLAAGRGADAPRLALLAAGMGVVAMGVLAYSWWQVRRRRWRHVDASGPGERRALNRFLLALLATGTLVAWLSAQRELALGLGLSTLLVAAAMLSARACKLSLHVAFSVYAAALLLELSWAAGATAAAFATGVVWSRLALARHAPRDLAAGAAAGALAGLAFWRLVPLAGS